MRLDQVPQLVIQSVLQPTQAARRIFAFQLSRETLWTALALAIVLNTLFLHLSNMMIPGPSILPGFMTLPMAYLAIVGAGLTASVYVMFYLGRWLGGTGPFEDIMKTVIWLQVLRVTAQAVSMVLVLTIPFLAAIFALAVTIWGLYVTVMFVNEAHRFNAPLRAAGLLLMTAFAIAFTLSFLLTLMGGTALEIPQNV
jgi:hypothetical protein